MKRRYIVRLTSDDWASECEFELTAEQRDWLLRIAEGFNSKAKFAIDHRVVVIPASAAERGDVRMKLSDYANYDELIKATGLTIEASETFGDYQGDYVYVVRDGSRRGVAIVGYGSCSGCDALEASHGDHAAMEEIAWSIRRSVVWGTDDELRAKLKGEQSRLSWYGSEYGYQEAVDKLLAPPQDAA